MAIKTLLFTLAVQFVAAGKPPVHCINNPYANLIGYPPASAYCTKYYPLPTPTCTSVSTVTRTHTQTIRTQTRSPVATSIKTKTKTDVVDVDTTITVTPPEQTTTVVTTTTVDAPVQKLRARGAYESRYKAFAQCPPPVQSSACACITYQPHCTTTTTTTTVTAQATTTRTSTRPFTTKTTTTAHETISVTLTATSSLDPVTKTETSTATVTTCSPPRQTCPASDGSTTCVNTDSDDANCGSCGNQCPQNSHCSNGRCSSVECVGKSCDNIENCNAEGTCGCAVEAESGLGYCTPYGNACGASCQTTADCGDGKYCAQASCCGGTKQCFEYANHCSNPSSRLRLFRLARRIESKGVFMSTKDREILSALKQ